MLKPQTRPRIGRRSLFRDKVRDKPVTITLTKDHHAKLDRAIKRLTRALQRLTRDDKVKVKVTRADVIALLIENFSGVVVLPPGEDGSPTEE